MDAIDGQAVALRPEEFGVPDVLDAVRGALAVALARCDDGSDAGLEICAAWESLDDVSASPSLLEMEFPSIFGAIVVIATARRLLRGAILRVEPLSSAFVLSETLRHLDEASAILAAETACDGPSWG